MRLIDGEALRKAMYHEAFETDTDMQRWESGCWVRYKLFENALDAAPTVDAVPVIRCKDCRWGKEVSGNIECWTDINVPPEYHGYEWFCPNGEREDDAVK